MISSGHVQFEHPLFEVQLYIPHGRLPPWFEGAITHTFGTDDVRIRTFGGGLVRAKARRDTQLIATRIRDVMNAEVLAVQEVEHVQVLREFNDTALGGLYPHFAVVEGNDSRMIDVAVLI